MRKTLQDDSFVQDDSFARLITALTQSRTTEELVHIISTHAVANGQLVRSEEAAFKEMLLQKLSRQPKLPLSDAQPSIPPSAPSESRVVRG